MGFALDIPEPYCSIGPGAGQEEAIRTESDGSHNIAVPLERAQALAALYVPQTHCLIGAAAGQGETIRADRKTERPIGVTCQDGNTIACTGVPQPDSQIVAGGDGGGGSGCHRLSIRQGPG